MSHWRSNAQAILDSGIELSESDHAGIKDAAESGREPYYMVKAVIHELYWQITKQGADDGEKANS